MAAPVSNYLLISLILIILSSAFSEDLDPDDVKIDVIEKPKSCDFEAENGDYLTIRYKGMLEDGTVFDSNYDTKEPFEFRLGDGEVIEGWEIGLEGMCVGEKRKLTIPSSKGYGEQGSPPTIPGGATLIFETELLDIDEGNDDDEEMAEEPDLDED